MPSFATVSFAPSHQQPPHWHNSRSAQKRPPCQSGHISDHLGFMGWEMGGEPKENESQPTVLPTQKCLPQTHLTLEEAQLLGVLLYPDTYLAFFQREISPI